MENVKIANVSLDVEKHSSHFYPLVPRLKLVCYGENNIYWSLVQTMYHILWFYRPPLKDLVSKLEL